MLCLAFIVAFVGLFSIMAVVDCDTEGENMGLGQSPKRPAMN